MSGLEFGQGPWQEGERTVRAIFKTLVAKSEAGADPGDLLRMPGPGGQSCGTLIRDALLVLEVPGVPTQTGPDLPEVPEVPEARVAEALAEVKAEHEGDMRQLCARLGEDYPPPWDEPFASWTRAQWSEVYLCVPGLSFQEGSFQELVVAGQKLEESLSQRRLAVDAGDMEKIAEAEQLLASRIGRYWRPSLAKAILHALGFVFEGKDATGDKAKDEWPYKGRRLTKLEGLARAERERLRLRTRMAQADGDRTAKLDAVAPVEATSDDW